MLIVYGLTIFVSAMLLFVVQPMFARMALPLLGGTPAVWNTALVFYQAVLLAGYGYAHLLTKRLAPKKQVAVHLGVLALALVALPIGVPAGWVPPRSENPLLWLLALLGTSVGLPFFAVSATSPLLQTWFSQTGHKAAKDPYFLYVASNVGSMLALLSYPVLIEPRLTLRLQSAFWTIGFGGLLALMLACGALLWRTARASAPAAAPDAAAGPASAPLSAARRLRWIALAAVPSSLMVSVTTYLSTDLAAIPLLWIIPLAIYLLTFVLVFAKRPPIPQWLIARAMPIVLLPLVITLAARASEPITLLIPLHLAGFFVFTMMTHGQLAADRPEPRHLTEFYLLMSLGGVIGGAFNALLAPLIFTSVLEYPLTLVLACLLAPRLAQAPAKLAGRRWDALLPLAAGGLAAGGFFAAKALGYGGTPIELALMYAVPMLLCFSMSRRPVRFALGVSAVLAASALSANAQGAVLFTDRSFFGINKVVLRSADNRRMLIHGNTLHGLQNVQPADQRQPLAYYYPTGPIGQVFTAARAVPELRRVAVVGLGSGALACYAAPGQSWTFYEIDPVVAEIARDPRYFSYLSDCAPDARIELGDARLSLRAAASQGYDILVLDAYSSDAIPVHLVTREALRLYLDKLAPGGILAFHISNRHLDLEPVLGNLAQDAGLAARTRNDTAISPEEERDGKWPAQWVVMGREAAALDRLGLEGDWQPIRRAPATPVWTDDYSSIVQTLRLLSDE